ncbi:hypothetical protein lerEdw1_003347 [Lerista edwardsae]|nr:hypothetical protein lerEdw1_003347 [Lerista edwardsae]
MPHELVPVDFSSHSHRAVEMATPPQARSTSPPVVALQNGLSDEEALQRALEMSLAESMPNAQPHSTQEDEDLALARALSASEEEYRRQQQQQQQARSTKPSSCRLS